MSLAAWKSNINSILTAYGAYERCKWEKHIFAFVPRKCNILGKIERLWD